MAIFKCKMCGGSLEINSETVATCEYCGMQQTLPKLNDDRRANLYDRANHFRRNNEFDKAMGIYEQILNDDTTDAEAYWSLVLCRYGIEYVEDPASRKRVPTVNRAQFTSIFDDDNYKSALQYADADQRAVYEAEAKTINEMQKDILAISQKEEPFDVFICYKETDRNGRRTPDSVLANDLYHQLTQEGYKVFFSRITLEDKLGVAYEPYIFAALNSSKVMVALGTKPEYFNAVWVKNEWSRYLALIKNGAKKILIPAYKDMDPYDLPEEFSHLQAQDMGKLGFMQDLIRGIKKIMAVEEAPKAVVQETVVVSAAPSTTAPLLKRIFMFLEDGDFISANDYCEKVLDIDPENAQAYLGKLMAELHVKNQDDLKGCANPFDNNINYQKALRFGDDKLNAALTGYIENINIRKEADRKEAKRIAKRKKKIALIMAPIVCAAIAVIIMLTTASKYNNAIALMNEGKLNTAYGIFQKLGNYKDSADHAGRIRLTQKEGELKKAEIGEYIHFGAYEQDDKKSNGKEDISWLVLDIKDGKALVLSQKVLDSKPYNKKHTDVTWETCTLRKWLNEDFLDAAFSTDEKALIPTVTVSADNNPQFSTNPGNETQDQVFLLSISEVYQYLNNSNDNNGKSCYPTKYAVGNRLWVDTNGSCTWWQRSPGENQGRAAYITWDDLIEFGGSIDDDSKGVRPAMWIDLSAIN